MLTISFLFVSPFLGARNRQLPLWRHCHHCQSNATGQSNRIQLSGKYSKLVIGLEISLGPTRRDLIIKVRYRTNWAVHSGGDDSLSPVETRKLAVKCLNT
jgi:hypothetical protein